ncbi:MAG: UvrB/UvrC motif-containing protein [Lentisphaeraceae bacterium]|nr:UvrB/UvrC motif-containing protein [Lentisphaeraceae bacterium]
MQKICDICKKNVAAIHIEKHAGENHTQMKICCQCAGIEALSPENLKSEDIQKIIADLAFLQKPSEPEECSECGTTTVDFDKSKRVGCGACYDNLKASINLQLHPNVVQNKHLCKTPFKLGFEPIQKEEVDELQVLEARLSSLVAEENYEFAAKVRDKIAELKKALS